MAVASNSTLAPEDIPVRRQPALCAGGGVAIRRESRLAPAADYRQVVPRVPSNTLNTVAP